MLDGKHTLLMRPWPRSPFRYSMASVRGALSALLRSFSSLSCSFSRTQAACETMGPWRSTGTHCRGARQRSSCVSLWLGHQALSRVTCRWQNTGLEHRQQVPPLGSCIVVLLPTEPLSMATCRDKAPT